LILRQVILYASGGAQVAHEGAQAAQNGTPMAHRGSRRRAAVNENLPKTAFGAQYQGFHLVFFFLLMMRIPTSFQIGQSHI
jgi:hypothetical protein